MTALVAQSPVLSPRPNPPGSAARPVHPNPRALAILNSTRSPAITASAASTPGDEALDLAEQMNKETREKYITGKRLGEGTYAVVYTGHFRTDPNRLVAIKKIKVQQEWKDGIPMDAIREIKFLQELSHPNIIKLYDVYSTKDQNISLVLEHLPLGDIEGLWKSKQSYTPADIKSWSNMLAQAVWWCHAHFILHRDIKGNNLLIAADGTVKLADFGLARSFADPARPMTHVVITRFYRPPELLYGARHYGGKVDIWSVGCVIAELAIRRFFLTADTDLGQIATICEHFGVPTEETWPGVSKLENYLKPSDQPTLAGAVGSAPRKGHPLSWWKATFPLLGDDGIDLLRAMLTPDPNKRLSAKGVLDHAYWTNAPKPTKKEDLPKQGGGEEKMGADLKRRGGEVETGRADKVARKLDFASMR